ncbi:hypothetical protein [Naasia lichenicola]|uniref:Uncharacterized protein n=1 Tax=Naasia lichenicola TaxID=2565933 RepID=A0A4S4FN64_9MICO|nr:hypothetical protein [Naasia lichenicola]THG30676.1 hypothetical protein E6C64_08530 [Naasia lichenicola]THG31913.1 hypothetical protein E6C64_07675 [Naasia lichenicola]
MADYSTANVIDSIIDDAKDPTFSRDRVLRYIQDKSDEVLGHHRFKFTEDIFDEEMSADTVTLDYESDHQDIIDITLTDATTNSTSHPLYLAPDLFFEQYPMPDTSRPGRPTSYTDYAGEIYWNCPTDREYIARVRHGIAPKRLEDSTEDKPQLPVEFKNILIKGGLAGVERYRQNFDIAAVYDRQCEDLSEDLLGRYGLRKRAPGKVRSSRMRGAEI